MDFSDQERLIRQRKKWIWGCTGGCLGLMVVVAAVIIGFYMWLARALPVPAAEAFLTPEANAFLFVRVAPEDPMMVEVPVRLAMQPAVRGRVPTKDSRPLQVDAEQMRAAVVGVAPLQLILVGTAAEGSPQLRWAFAVSITRLGRLADLVIRRLVVKQGLPEAETYKGGTILVADEKAAFAVRTNTYMVAEEKPLLRAWLDGIQADLERAERSDAGEPPLPAGLDPQLLEAYGRLDRGSPVRFACLNAHGEIAALLGKLPSEQVRVRLREAGMAGPGVQSVSGQLQSMNSRDASMTLRVSCVDDETAAGIEAALTELVGSEERAPHLRDPVVQRQDGHVVELTGRVENLPDRIAALLNEREPPD